MSSRAWGGRRDRQPTNSDGERVQEQRRRCRKNDEFQFRALHLANPVLSTWWSESRGTLALLPSLRPFRFSLSSLHLLIDNSSSHCNLLHPTCSPYTTLLDSERYLAAQHLAAFDKACVSRTFSVLRWLSKDARPTVQQPHGRQSPDGHALFC